MTPSIVLSNGIEITTSCGVYLDTVTGLHYLLKVDATKVYIYDLVSTSCAEKLRPKLLDIGISADNRERIEAYILSRALPIPSSVVELVYAPGTPFDINQMGYGWHWNWSGTMCDIVVTTNDGTSNHSTHYRITMSHTPHPAMVWTQTPSTIEGPTTWKNNKHNSVICYPVWDYSGFQKIGTVATPTGNSPYYAFYNRDVLKVARFSAGTTSNSKNRVRSPSYYNIGGQTTQGSDALSVVTTEEWSGQTISLTCGGASVSYQSGSYSDSTYGHTSPAQTSPALSSLGWNRESIAMSTTNPYEVPNGKPSPIGPLFHTSTEYEASVDHYGGVLYHSGSESPNPTISFAGVPGWYRYNTIYGGWPATFTHWDGTIGRLLTTAFISAPPFYDAESLFSFGGKTTTSTESGTKIDKSADSFYIAYGIGPPSTVPTILMGVLEIMGEDFGTNISTYSYSDPPVVTSSSTTLMECNAGTLTAIIPNVNPFFNVTYNVVPVTLGSYASAQGSSVFSGDLTVDQGNAPAVLTGIPFTYSGWA